MRTLQARIPEWVAMPSSRDIAYMWNIKYDTNGARFGSTYTKIGTIQRRLAWPLRKDDTQIREAFHIFSNEVDETGAYYTE